MLATGSALAAATWIAPSVLTLDRVSAAVGSCGIPPVQVDWSDAAGTIPNTITAADGTVVTITRADPFGVANAGFFGFVYTAAPLSGFTHPILMAMTNASNGDFTSLTFSFSQPVAPCFTMLDVDFGNGGSSWEDTMIMTGTLAGTTVNLGAGDIATGPANTVIGPNTVLGIGGSGQTSTAGNVTVTYPSDIDTLEIRHQDDSAFTDFQYIGIHDLRWC